MRAETTIYRARTRRRRQSAVVLRVAGVVGVVLVAVVGIVGLAFAGSPAKLAGGTTIGGLDVGGLTAEQAIAKLRARERSLENTRVAFTAAGTASRYSASQLGVQADWPAAVKQALHDGSGFWPVRGFRRLVLRISGDAITPRLTSYPSALDYAVGEIAKKVDAKHVEASLVRHGLRIAVVPGKAGRALDKAAARRALVAALGAATASHERGDPGTGRRSRRHRGPARAGCRRARLVVSAPVAADLRGDDRGGSHAGGSRSCSSCPPAGRRSSRSAARSRPTTSGSSRSASTASPSMPRSASSPATTSASSPRSRV